MNRPATITLLAATITALVGVLHWRAIRPQSDAIRAAMRQVQELSVDDDRQQSIQSGLRHLQAIARQQESATPADLNIAGLLDDLRSDFASLSIHALSWNISPATAHGEFQSVEIEVGLEAEFLAIQELLRRIEAYPRLVRFEHLTLRKRPGDRSPSVSGVMKVKVFARPNALVTLRAEVIK